MKKILLISTILFLSFSSFAAWKKAMLRIKHEFGRSLSIEIDGKRFNKISKSLTVGDISPGAHRIKIFKYNSNGHGYSTGIMVYQGKIQVLAGRIYYCTVGDGIMDIEENCCIDNYGHWNNNDNWENTDEWQTVEQPRQEEDPQQTWNNNNQWNQEENRNSYYDKHWDNYNGQMSEGRFNELIIQIRKASFENSKVSVAKQALITNKISCKQLLSILNEFSFESTKLQFAKDAYKQVYDKNNYYIINDAFTFQSSKDDLLDFLERKQ